MRPRGAWRLDAADCRPLYQRTFANYYANPGSRIDSDRYTFSRYERRLSRTEDATTTDIPDWYALPPDWDTLTAAKGYPPLSSFTLR